MKAAIVIMALAFGLSGCVPSLCLFNCGDTYIVKSKEGKEGKPNKRDLQHEMEENQ